MTREEMKKLLPIMQAWVDGKIIQVWTNDTWVDEEYPCFFEELSQFRIKPESKYRPFKTQKECWEEMHKHPDFGWVKGNVTGEYKQVNRVFGYKTELIFNISYNSPADYSPEMMFDSYTFTDGTPFGIKEEQQ